jgi:P-type Ca2+ transporter type 2A
MVVLQIHGYWNICRSGNCVWVCMVVHVLLCRAQNLVLPACMLPCFSLSLTQKTHFHQCDQLYPEVGCEMFNNYMSRSASTMSLSILVVIEMLNACNALSQSDSLLTLPVWKNMTLVWAITLSMVLHFGILYIPFFQTLFQVSPLNLDEWKAVLWISAPVMYLLSLFEWANGVV